MSHRLKIIQHHLESDSPALENLFYDDKALFIKIHRELLDNQDFQNYLSREYKDH